MPSIESISQPRRIFCVAQAPSPFKSFFTDAGSAREDLSPEDRGRNTVSSDDKRARRTLFRVRGGPAARAKKSSTKRSMYDKGRACRCGRLCVIGTSAVAVAYDGGAESAATSRRCQSSI